MVLCTVTEMPFISKFVSNYLDTNPKGSFDKPVGFTSNGDGFKELCHRVNYSLWDSTWIANDQIEKKLQHMSVEEIIEDMNQPVDMTIFMPMLKISATYCAHKYLRRAWCTLWSSTFPQTRTGVIPPELIKMKYNWRKGFNILMELVPEMVI